MVYASTIIVQISIKSSQLASRLKSSESQLNRQVKSMKRCADRTRCVVPLCSDLDHAGQAEFGKGKLRSAIDGDEEVESAFFGPDLGDVDVEEADRVGLEFFLGCFFAFDFGQPGAADSGGATSVLDAG
jgi:hypothetical protein